MKDFLKYTFATVTGIVITGVILFLLGVMIVASILSSSDSTTTIEPNSIMMLDLKGTLSERVQDKPWDKLLGDQDLSIGLNDILSSIKKAKGNKDIKGIYLQAGALSGSFASFQEIRDALSDFKKSGKFIVAYSDSYTQGMYYIASVADKVLLNPQGSIDWRGLSATVRYYKNLLDKLGVEMQVFKVGTYKSAVEPFTSTSMSDANREQMNELIGSLWGKIVNDVSQARKVSPAALNAYADNMTTVFYPAQEAIKSHMADKLIYKNDIRDYLKKMLGIDKDDDLNILGLKDMINVKRNVPKDKSGNIIAVYYAYGEIVDQEGNSFQEDNIVSNDMAEDLRDLKDDDDVKAVVIRVNSPGGSAFGSEQIWYAIKELKAKKPVVISMGDYAASGGYYISCNANKIVAEPTTLTGSIGIFGMFPNVTKLTNKIGITYDEVKTNKFSTLGSIAHNMSDEEKALIQMRIANGYNTFVTRCANGRHMTNQAIEKIAEGRVWTGEKALSLGLVDELGDLNKAIDIAVKLSKVQGHSVISYPEEDSFFSSIMEEMPDNYIETRLLKSKLGDYFDEFSTIRSLEKQSPIQARMPYNISFQ
jgi:protease-4